MALAGDAAACVSLLAGEGTGLAMVEAYVLAGRFAIAETTTSRHSPAIRKACCRFSTRKQESAARFASSFVPKTALGVGFRNVVTGLLQIPLIADVFIGRDLRDDFEPPEYAS